MSSTSVKVAPPTSLLSTPTPSRKQEHLDAGRRRLEKFREKKKAETSKKTPVVKNATEADGKNSSDGKKSSEDGPGAVPAGGASGAVPAVDKPLTIRWSPTEGDQTETRDSLAEEAAAKNGVGEEEKLASTGKDLLQSNDSIAVDNFAQREFASSGRDQGLSSQTGASYQSAGVGAGDKSASQGKHVLESNESIVVDKLAQPEFGSSVGDQRPASRTTGGYSLSGIWAGEKSVSSGKHVLESKDSIAVDNLARREFASSVRDDLLSSRTTASSQSAGIGAGEKLASTGKHLFEGTESIVVDNLARHESALSGRDHGLFSRTAASYQSAGNGYVTAGRLSAHGMSKTGDKHGQSSAGKDDFNALEQHIDDLTQEKYSLERGLSAANEVANQLTNEHLSLTEKYNQQGKVVNQLREELGRHQAELKEAERSRKDPVLRNAADIDGKKSTEDGPSAASAVGASSFVRAMDKPPLAVRWSSSEGDHTGARDSLAGGEGAATINGVVAGLSAHSPSRKGDKHWQSSAGMDDFSALEQHIEDLTQEKYALQRGLSASNEVANQLAKENSSLTENYNQQGKVVNQLREELARHQAEIKAQTLVIASMRAERERAQHESAVAVEQSKTLAAEVVALEERLLQVKSQGLKLERSMESLTTENEQQKKKVIALEKDRANLKSMFDAVQEEKKMLAGRLHKASKSQQAPAAHPSSVAKADASTSTEDVELLVETLLEGSVSMTSPQVLGNRELSTAVQLQPPEGSVASSSASPAVPSQAGDIYVPGTSAAGAAELASLRASATPIHSLQLPPLTSTIPESHMERIQNIDILIRDLADDKAALIRALNAESASAAELRSENLELLQKLEAQTQRLELVIAQSMAAHDGTMMQANRAEAPSAGEGEGVLGWIKWLIPSRSSPASRRRYKRL